MLDHIRNSRCSKILWGFIGIYLFNISVDVSDAHPDFVAEDLSINDQESIVEIIVEQVLGYENAFKEYDDNDTEDQDKKTNLKIELIAQRSVDESLKSPILANTQQKFADYNAYLINGFNKLDIPPPKV